MKPVYKKRRYRSVALSSSAIAGAVLNSVLAHAQSNGTVNTTITVTEGTDITLICNSVFSGAVQFSTFSTVFFTLIAVVITLTIISIVVFATMAFTNKQSIGDNRFDFMSGIVFISTLTLLSMFLVLLGGLIGLSQICQLNL